ncbi:MAG: hypothetical protein ACYTG0_38875 [Planctomycetota bacterium]|jgi:HD superfamily phosphohydrolase
MPSTRNFYDPLYDVVAFRRRFWEEIDPVTDNFDHIIRTYEFNRLNLLRQEGVSWLAFPSASYTRFLSALGCWFLADVALEHVQVRPRTRKESPWLTAWLEDVQLLEEFRLAVLLRNIGTFPFTNSLENNDKLKVWYREREQTKDIPLRHEDFTVSLIRGEGSGRIFKLYSEYLREWTGDDFDSDRLISNLLDELGGVDLDWLVYLIDPSQDPPNKPPEKATKDRATDKPEEEASLEEVRRLAEVVRHLVRGLIDVGSMDRASRASYHLWGSGDLVHSRRILHSVLLQLGKGDDSGQVVLSSSRVGYPVKSSARWGSRTASSLQQEWFTEEVWISGLVSGLGQS